MSIGEARHSGVAYVFGPFRLVPDEYLLLRDGEPVPLPPQAFDLLRLLVESAGHLKSRDELIEALWPTTVVEDNSLPWYVSAVRKALGDDSGEPRYIGTVRGRGYRFIAPVQVEDAGRSEEDWRVSQRRSWPWLTAGGLVVAAIVAITLTVLWPRLFGGAQAVNTGSRRPSIAVLPFENLNVGKKDAYFVAGMQDLILTKLADIGELKVISRTSTAKYESHPDDLKAIARQLGVATILEGSVQKTGNEVLINVQLINARTGNHIWAKSYMRTLKNVFGVEGEVAEKVAAALKTKLDPTERTHVASVFTHDPAAYDAYLRGLSLEFNTSSFSGITLETVASHYEQAVKLDPDFALAWARLSSVDSSIFFNEFNFARLARAKAALGHALALAPDAAATQIAKGTYAYYGHLDYAKALAAYRKALQISPNSAVAMLDIGFIERREGHWQTANDYMQRALALDPRNVEILSNLAMTYLALRRDAKSKELLRGALAISPSEPIVAALLAVVYQGEGNLAESGKILASVRIPPSYWEISYPCVIQQALFIHRYEDAVHLAQEALATPNLPRVAKASYYRWLGVAEQLAGNGDAARHAYRQAAAIMKRVVAPAHMLPPTVAVGFGFLALVYTGLGEKEAAFASARRAVALLSPSRDAFQGWDTAAELAAVQAHFGDKSAAIATLKRLLAKPTGYVANVHIKPALLRLAPIWKPLRGDPAFQALLKKYAKYKPHFTVATPTATAANE